MRLLTRPRAPAIARIATGVAAGMALGLAAATSVAAERTLVVVSGLGGEEVYSERFHQWSGRLVTAARERLGLAEDEVVWLSEDPERDATRIHGRSDAGTFAAVIDGLAERTAPGDVVMIVLIGHGTARPGRALFNLPGPDLSAERLAEALDGLSERTVVVVNTAPASGAFIRPLAAAGRVVATATANGAENQHTRFGFHFAEAYAGEAADADKDGRVSVLEAFDYARREVRRDYERERRLLTEHALLDDDGDGRGVREPSALEGDGALAHTVHLAASAFERGQVDPIAAMLEAEARTLVGQIEGHRRRKAGLTPEAYERELERLLVELALNRRTAARHESPGPESPESR